MKKSAFLLLACFFCLTAHYSFSQWELQYPEPTDKRLADVCFVDELNGWIVGEEGTILHTSDGGLTWDFQQSGTTFRLRSVCFTDIQTGWAVGDDQGPIPGAYVILHTTDGGNTWVIQDSNSAAYLRSVFFIDPVEGWAVGTNGTLLHTENGGTEWSSQWSGSSNLDFEEVFFINPQNGWIAAGTGLYHTVDGGLNWNEQVSGPFLSVYFINEFEGWASTWGAGYGSAYVFHTTNAFTTWDTINGSGNYDSSSGFYSIFFKDANTGWTLDYWCNWGGWISSCSYHIRKTVNGGESWEMMELPIYTSLSALQFTNNGNGFVVGSHGVVLSTENWEDQWFLLGQGNNFGFSDIEFVDGMHGWAVGVSRYNPSWVSYGSAIVHTSDGGANWEIQNSNLTGPIQEVDFIDPNIGWAVGNSITANTYDTTFLIHTTDGGQNWTVQQMTTDFTFKSVFFIDNSTGWIVGGNTEYNGNYEGKILKTQNGGINWLLQSCDSCKVLNDVFFIDENNGWAMGKSIYHTSDGGQNWVFQDSSTTDYNLLSIHFTDLDNGWVVGYKWGDGGVLLHTSDGGLNWDHDFYNYELYGVSFSDQDNGLISGSDGTVLKTMDGGLNWEEMETNTEYVLYDVCAINESQAYAAGGWGTILYNENILSHSGGASSEDPHNTVFSIYPNPCAGAAHLKLVNSEQGSVISEIFTISGTKIRELINEHMPAGTYEMAVDLSDLPAGIYYCVIRTNKEKYATKLIKL